MTVNENNNNTLDKILESDAETHKNIIRNKIEKFLSKEKSSDVLIIKSHLICEYYINQILIIKELCKAKEVKDLDFYHKVNKALSINNPEEKILHEKIIELNKLRNKVGHELEYILSESDVDSLGYISGKDYILEKYKFTDMHELLRRTLIMIAIDISILLFKLVYRIKIQEKTKI